MKRALVLSGGGSHGSFQVGAIKALVEAGYRWDVVTGVSVGAINGTQIAMYSKENQFEAAHELEKFWLEDIKGNESIYRKHLPWYFNYLASLWKGSLYNTTPLLNLLTNKLNVEKLLNSGVGLEVGAVSLTSGEYKAIPKTEKDFVKWILASATMPLLFEPVVLNGEKWVDGGVRNITPISDLVDFGNDIDEIDVILTGPKIGTASSNKSFTSIKDVAERCLELAVDEVWRTDLDYIRFDDHRLIKVNVYSPEHHLSFKSFDFKPEDIKKAIDLGYTETKTKL